MLSGLIDTAIFLSSFVLVLSFLVYFHELGHYSVARFFNVAVERFSIGFGKPLAEWTAKNGTRWSIGRIPLGGYVKFLGDAGAASNPDADALSELKEKYEKDGAVAIDEIFHFKPLWQRALVVLAGPLFNFILAVLIFAGLGLTIGSYTIESLVGTVLEGSAAEEAGILPGDKILTMNGRDVSQFDDLQKYVVLKSNNSISTIIDRNGERIELEITPRKVTEKDFIGGSSSSGKIGIGSSQDAEIIKIKFNPITALGFGVDEVQDTISMTGTYIGRIFTGKEDGKQLGSVVKIAAITGKTAIDATNEDVTFGERMSLLVTRLLS